MGCGVRVASDFAQNLISGNLSALMDDKGDFLSNHASLPSNVLVQYRTSDDICMITLASALRSIA